MLTKRAIILQLLFAVIFTTLGCKKETVQPKLNVVGTWNVNYTMHSASFADNYKVYNWAAKLTVNADGTAHAVHQAGNPIFNDKQVDEDFKWGYIDDHTVYLRSLNWSVTSQTMNYDVREYSNSYGFDDLKQFWETTLKK
jgi:hypothetical protein